MAETIDAAATTDLTYDSASWSRRVDANHDEAKTDEDSPVTINVLANDVGALGIINVNGAPITADTPVTLRSGAKVSLNKDGSLTYDPNDQFEKLAAGETADDTFSYTISGSGKRTDTATVTVHIAGADEDPGPNQAPVANNDSAFLFDYYPGPVPYAEDADSAATTDGPIYTTLALGEEGDPDPYPQEVTINVLDNDKDPDGDPLKVATIAGKEVDIDPNTEAPDTVTLESGAEVRLNKDGSLTYSKGIIVYADRDPLTQTEDAVTLQINSDGSSELVPIDPPEPLPYPAPWLVDSFSYTAVDDKGAESNAATVTVYRPFYDYVLEGEPMADASPAAPSDEPNDVLIA